MASSDRYEPLPSLPELPAFLLRKIPPRARRPAALAACLLLAAAVVGLVLAVPAIVETKAERAAADRERRQATEARRNAMLRAEMRPRRGRGTPARGLTGPVAITARRALAVDVGAAVQADATSRVRAGEFTQTVERVECERFPRGVRGEDPAADLQRARGRYSCLAVTADAPKLDTSNPSSLGYPYRALVHFPSGRFTFCKVSGRPGEGALTREIPVRVPKACGGSG